MTVVAGWYPDPWGEADLRWWDGVAWTGSVHVTAIDLVGTQQSSSQPLARLLAAQGRIAVVDVETTGLYSTDRVVEVAVVTVNRDGSIEEEFETLVNPLRDIGPTWIHGIDSAMVRDAPTFADVAHHVASRVDGAVVAGHNVRFDMRMLGLEFERAGIDIDWGAGLDTLSVTRCKLAQACMDYGVALDGATSGSRRCPRHRRVDAHVGGVSFPKTAWRQWLAHCEFHRYAYADATVTPTRLLPRHTSRRSPKGCTQLSTSPLMLRYWTLRSRTFD
jgi:DNA polymerase III epsilon subunit-like protein